VSSVLDRVLTAESLCHYYNTERSGGVAKLFYPYARAAERRETILDAIHEQHFLDTAVGYSLDLLGAGIGVGRLEDENDEAYRKRLWLEYMILTSSGTLEQVRAILAEALSIDPANIWAYYNESPSQVLDDLPYFVEISIGHSALLLDEERPWFKFSDNAEVRTAASEQGFDTGQWLGRATTKAEWLAEVHALLERILATGVQYVIAGRGGFRFSLEAETRTPDSDRGFDRGPWRGVYEEDEE